jgi:mannose-6-phosphate isomerase-like protein (cupin superfamily)
MRGWFTTVADDLVRSDFGRLCAGQENEMSITRRDVFSLIPAALAASALVSGVAEAGRAQGSSGSGQTPATPLPSAIYPFEQLQVHQSKTGTQSRPVLKGKLATGESIEVHETTLPPGGAPHAPHHHEHSEMWLIREGTVELNISGKTQQLGPGSVGFVRSNEEHGIRNPSDKPAAYFVVAIGPTAVK